MAPRAVSPGIAQPPHPSIPPRLILKSGSVRQRQAILTETHEIWGGRLSATSYIELNEIADCTAFGSRMHWLVLVDREEPDGRVYANVEIYPRDALVVKPGSSDVTRVRSASMHHLHVPKHARHHGLGRIMLERLSSWAEEAGIELVYGAAMVGDGVWRQHSTWHANWILVTSPDKLLPGESPAVRPIAVNELDSLIAADTKLLESELLAASPMPHLRIAIPYDLDFYRMLRDLHGIQTGEALSTAGWIIGDVAAPEAFMLVMPKLTEPALLIHRWRAATTAQMHALLAAAASFARSQGLTQCVSEPGRPDACRLRMTGDKPDAMRDSSGMVDMRDLLASTGCQDDCVEDTYNGVAFFGDLRGQNAFDFLGRQLGTSCSPMTGSVHRSASK